MKPEIENSDIELRALAKLIDELSRIIKAVSQPIISGTHRYKGLPITADLLLSEAGNFVHAQSGMTVPNRELLEYASLDTFATALKEATKRSRDLYVQRRDNINAKIRRAERIIKFFDELEQSGES